MADSYIKTEWAPGKVIGSEQLNKIEEQLDILTSAKEDNISEFQGATSNSKGSTGWVPAPNAGEQNRVLKGNGSWGNPDRIETINAPTDTQDRNIPILVQDAGKVVQLATDSKLIYNINTHTLETDNIVANGSQVTNIDAGNITDGILDAARVPNLNATKITSGTISVGLLPEMKGANAAYAGTAGIVPAPPAKHPNSFLCGDGTWVDFGDDFSISNGVISLNIASYFAEEVQF